MIPGSAGTTELGVHHTAAHLDQTRIWWLWLVLATFFPLGFQEALDLARGSPNESLVAMPLPIDLELARALVVSMVAWVVALVWTHPRAITMRSEPNRALIWYMASFLLVFFGSWPGLFAASSQQRHGLALSCYLTSLALLVLMYPRTRDFPIEEPPPPAPIWDGAIEIKRFACPHCGARTFGFADRLQIRSSVLHACRKCRAWVSVSWLWDGLRWASSMTLSMQGLPHVVDRLPVTAGSSLLLELPLAVSTMAGLWIAVSMLMPLVTRYPPPPRSTAQSP